MSQSDVPNAELTRSQFDAFARQIPLLYLILAVNTAAVAFTHRHSAPAWLAVLIPGMLCLSCIVRVAIWLRSRKQVLSDAQVARRLRSTILLMIVFGIAFTGWALALYPYGDAFQQSQVAFYVSITVIGCIFCLMHMRMAALLLAAIVIVPFTVFFALTGNPVFIAISVNMALVTLAMIVILLTYYRDFANLVESKKALDIKQAETQVLSDENFRLANRDSLTSLPNRRRFFADIEALLSERSSDSTGFAVGILDLDGFKQINDLYGHSFGDHVLQETGLRLSNVACPDIAFARLGGDEFGVVVTGNKTRDQLLYAGARICQALQLPHVLPEATVRLSGSLGFAIYPDGGDTPKRLLERADYALYHAKGHRRGEAVVFSQEHETQIRVASTVEQALRHADLNSEMSLVFQPIIDISVGRIVAFEALARWNSPTLGAVPPDTFITIAERGGSIHTLTEVLLSKALAFARTCPDSVRISFNLSTLDLTSEEALHRIIELTRSSGVAPDRLDFEVTETALINDFDIARKALQSLKELGVHISLDDFGTGYSSLSSVHRLPLDKLKVDRSFVKEIDRSSRDETSSRASATCAATSDSNAWWKAWKPRSKSRYCANSDAA